jgi:hypothetical protein
VYDDRARIAPEIARSTGLTLEGALFGFSCLERDASEAELRSLIDAAGDAERVHVVLSANVFVAPLRAMAIARAASERVTVRPSPRDPTLARELQRAVDDKGIGMWHPWTAERFMCMAVPTRSPPFARGLALASSFAVTARGWALRSSPRARRSPRPQRRSRPTSSRSTNADASARAS